jgi:hypothetical protein
LANWGICASGINCGIAGSGITYATGQTIVVCGSIAIIISTITILYTGQGLICAGSPFACGIANLVSILASTFAASMCRAGITGLLLSELTTRAAFIYLAIAIIIDPIADLFLWQDLTNTRPPLQIWLAMARTGLTDPLPFGLQ